MSIMGKDVWDAMVKLGFLNGPYDPRTNLHCANANNIARLLNEVLTKGQSWLPKQVKTEDAMRLWEANTPHEYVLRLYKFLNAMGYTVIGIDSAIEREVTKQTTSATDSPTKKTRP
jgi:hypothetical protein